MNNPPMQITIIPAGFGRNYFDVIAQQIDGKLEIAEGLGWDEMLGVIARCTCPTIDSGEPNRKIGKPLFLPAPKTTPPQPSPTAEIHINWQCGACGQCNAHWSTECGRCGTKK